MLERAAVTAAPRPRALNSIPWNIGNTPWCDAPSPGRLGRRGRELVVTG